MKSCLLLWCSLTVGCDMVEPSGGLGRWDPQDGGQVEGDVGRGAADAMTFEGPPPLDPIVEVRLGDMGPCTRTALGRVECSPSFLTESSTKAFTAIEAGARALSVGGTCTWHEELVACALMDHGVVRCSTNGAAQLETTFEGYELSLDARTLSVGRDDACVTSGDGRVRCWSTFYYEDHRPRLIEGIEGAIAISCSTSRCCGLDSDGEAWCWRSSGGVPAKRAGLRAPFGRIAASEVMVCVIAQDRSVACIDALGERTDSSGPAIDLDVWHTTVCWLDESRRIHCVTQGLPRVFDLPPMQQIDVGAASHVCIDWACPVVCGVGVSGGVECTHAGFLW